MIGTIVELLNILLEVLQPNLVDDGVICAHQVGILWVLNDLRYEYLAAAIRLLIMHLLHDEFGLVRLGVGSHVLGALRDLQVSLLVPWLQL